MILYGFYILISPFLWGVATIAALFSRKGRERILNEFSIRKKAIVHLKKERAGKKVILFHAASGGEFEQLKPLLPLFDREQYYLFQTFFSATIYRKENESSLFDCCCYLPFDSVLSSILFFVQVKPDLIVINRHDIWPSHIGVARLFGVKLAYINGNMHDKSFRKMSLLKNFNKRVYGAFDLITSGSERLERELQYVAGSRPKQVVTGDTRFDRVAERARNNQHDHFDVELNDSLILGSIIPSDYDVVFTALEKLKKSGTEWKHVLAVPHEVDEKSLLELESVLDAHGLSHERYSNSRTCKKDITVVNTVGMLAELYGYGGKSYVGAGFGGGVHSVIEPAVYNIPVSYGPNIDLLDEAVEMAELQIGTVVSSAGEFYEFLTMDSVRESEIVGGSKAFFAKRSFVSEKVKEELLKLI